MSDRLGAGIVAVLIFRMTKVPNMSEFKVNVRDNGPLLISGAVTICDAAGNAFDTGGKETVALCRCGQSARRPFCDGTHNRCGFQAAERAVTQ